ncbi:hypothetical protein [Mobilicoccus pelagius]|uniref:Uncharacterized protein n=1 Tax=Mobilicoccus pelagius NBRC 104925 TaxID=1089455 RepID=H5UQI7_9MICO|nr:hypothetical protein [Mobilicoccus pelagius]GAB47995.1 hypothetical protein MOPEL_032_00370 [Mobilicoccus pelagius NBRC 104925]
MSMFLTLATAAENGHVHLPMPAWAFGVLGLGVFLALLLFVWMFRHTASSLLEGGHGPAQGDFAHGNAPEGHGHDGRHGTTGDDHGRRH